ncbi:MAG: bifunctional metallophosphatase/5'-nucleotidase [Bacteroidales bacterium]|nr:bifunctional metallophosphatase/5'-nucleotidase [Bacteroidales bacterium]
MHKLLSFLFACSIFFSACSIGHQNSDAPVITIIHTNDTHSQIEPGKTRQGALLGGVVERAAMLQYQRQQDPDLLYFDAGDMFQGSPYFNIFKGELEILCMNQQKLVAGTLGNHEFDNGLEFLSEMLKKADFPLVSCNYHCEGTSLESLILPHLIIERHGVKIGITGVTVSPEGLIANRNWKGITFEDPRTAVNREADYLRNEGCDLVIVLSHLGYLPEPEPDRTNVYDNDLVPAIHGVDIIIGSHTHYNIEQGVYFNDADEQPVLVTQTGGKMLPMGYLKITMQKGSRYPKCKYSVATIECKKLHPDDFDLSAYGKEMRDAIKPYQEALVDQMNVRLGTAPEPLVKGKPQSTLGNFVADAYIQIGQKKTGKKVDFAIANLGGLRSEIDAGDVTIGTMFNIFPFENKIVVLGLKGSDLKQLIESNAGRKLDATGGAVITLEMDGDRCIASSILIDGKPINPDKIYYVSTLDFLAEGNSGMSALTRAVETYDPNISARDAMIEYVKELDAAGKPVSAKIDGRVIDKTKP